MKGKKVVVVVKDDDDKGEKDEEKPLVISHEDPDGPEAQTRPNLAPADSPSWACAVFAINDAGSKQQEPSFQARRSGQLRRNDWLRTKRAQTPERGARFGHVFVAWLGETENRSRALSPTPAECRLKTGPGRLGLGPAE
ncbi:uncharacterized protein A4U43_C05F9960 [Asparagus officinalis]|uniref:Uncharacterized protein n=1 Tax=Asparagus officinalis TaxID=4686 RepID=A0A5P1ET69_ASPOF|nr:uncharacterized protein A4U43_C05F9960 [Asparagus officinalis]